MPARPFIAIADDFSGAAEIAGTFHRHGLPVRVTSNVDAAIPNDETSTVIDLDTRRLNPQQARIKHQRIARRITQEKHLFYKKTDSALRGHISTEIKTLLNELPFNKVVFCPANPKRGRIIKKGNYYIYGTPICETEFAQDPYFPIRSSSVTANLPEFTSLPVRKASTLYSRTESLLIAEAASEEDLKNWASKIRKEHLPAGASPFLAAYLENLGHEPTYKHPKPNLRKRALFISGSLSENSRKTAESFKKKGLQVLELSDDWANTLPELAPEVAMVKFTRQKLSNRKELPRNLAEWLKKSFSQCQNKVSHLLIEGGDTAAAIMDVFSWHSCKVIYEWESGVVTLQPSEDKSQLITIKPGSYTWPKDILRTLEKA